jgi:hypothetical protein
MQRNIVGTEGLRRGSGNKSSAGIYYNTIGTGPFELITIVLWNLSGKRVVKLSPYINDNTSLSCGYVGLKNLFG